nr:hypothetical protein Q903MT_gene3444 [Picea sitchensis]
MGPTLFITQNEVQSPLIALRGKAMMHPRPIKHKSGRAEFQVGTSEKRTYIIRSQPLPKVLMNWSLGPSLVPWSTP